mgnify:CR=1 FL=1
MPSILANAACRRGIGRLRLGLRLGSRCRCAAGYGGARGVACRLHVLRWQPITARIVHGPQQSVFDRQRPCRCSVSRSLESGNEKRRPLSSHVRRLTYHVCGSFMDNKESRFQLFLLVYEPAARGFLARFALLNGLSRQPSTVQ